MTHGWGAFVAPVGWRGRGLSHQGYGLRSSGKTVNLTMNAADPLVQYVVVRRDLLQAPYRWPVGALITQGVHAAVSAVWKFRDVSDDVMAYCAGGGAGGQSSAARTVARAAGAGAHCVGHGAGQKIAYTGLLQTVSPLSMKTHNIAPLYMPHMVIPCGAARHATGWRDDRWRPSGQRAALRAAGSVVKRPPQTRSARAGTPPPSPG
eukprot:ctg_3712.g435